MLSQMIILQTKFDSRDLKRMTARVLMMMMSTMVGIMKYRMDRSEDMFTFVVELVRKYNSFIKLVFCLVFVMQRVMEQLILTGDNILLASVFILLTTCTETIFWSKRSECVALGCCRQNVVATINGFLKIVLKILPLMLMQKVLIFILLCKSLGLIYIFITLRSFADIHCNILSKPWSFGVFVSFLLSYNACAGF